jgi:salicylate hydroxylase
MKLQVIVIGAGIGGLALAQGLRRRGVEVAAYERDRTPADRLQGYRVHINTAGSRALHACLPPEVFAAFLATCGQPNTGIGMFTHRLRELIWFGSDRPDPDPDPVDGVKSASRISLRQVLLAGLDDVVRFGKAFTHYRRDPDGRVTACFADGSTATGDVLVGADGGNSRVRQQYLPDAQRVDTGVTGIQGKVWLTAAVQTLLPGRLVAGPVMIPGPRGLGMSWPCTSSNRPRRSWRPWSDPRRPPSATTSCGACSPAARDCPPTSTSSTQSGCSRSRCSASSDGTRTCGDSSAPPTRTPCC